MRATLASAGRRVVSATPIAAANNNNRLHRLDMADGPPLLAKLYYRDGRRRLEREHDALSLLAERCFPNVPRPIARDDDAYWAVYTFEPGAIRRPAEYTADDVRALARFAAELHRIPVSDGLEVRHAATRLLGESERYLSFAPDELRREIEPLVAAVPPYEPPPREQLRLSNGDFAPHNVLLGDDTMRVVDWEMSAWDDPACFVLDFVAHEATRGLSTRLTNLYLDTYLAEHSEADLTRWRAVYQRFQIGWTLGFLSAFNPAYLDRKRFANPNLDVAAFQAGQVAKLRARLERVVDSPPDPLIS